jgi:hypothetical protein
VKTAKSSSINFDPTFRGRKEVQKNKWTPNCLTEFHGVSEKNNRFSPRGLSFWANTVFKKKRLLSKQKKTVVEKTVVEKTVE